MATDNLSTPRRPHRVWSRIPEIAAILVVLAMGAWAVLGLTGCDGEGLSDPLFGKAIEGDDDTNNDDGDDGTPDPTPGTKTDLGTWITSYGDDWIATDARNGYIQYAASVQLKRNGTVLSGTGTVFRVFREGPTAYDRLSIKLSGTVSGDDATATVTSATGGSVYDSPTWRLRISGNRMVGMYVSYNSSNTLVRSGHALWHKVSTASLDGAWVSGFPDAHGTTAWPARDRTATLEMDYNAESNTLTGAAELIEQRNGDTQQTLSANITRGEVSLPEVGFTLGELGLENCNMDWYSLFSSSIGVGAYAQFDEEDILIRYGHATWYLTSSVTPNSYSYRWVTAFTDSAMASVADERLDYLISLKLTAEENNTVSGTGDFLSSEDPLDDFRRISVDESSMVGTHLKMTTRVTSTQEYFTWDLRLAGSILVGAYQHFDGLGNFISRGSAEWRRETSSTPSLAGRWVSGFLDTVASSGRAMTHFVLVNVTQQDSAGNLEGSGALRYGNTETSRRLFDLADSSVSDRDVVWVWRGADLFGDTNWRLRQAGNVLFGLYLNENSAGNFESRGSAMWIRTSDTGTL